MTQLINYRLLEFGIGGNIYTTEIGYKSRLRPLPPLTPGPTPPSCPSLRLHVSTWRGAQSSSLADACCGHTGQTVGGPRVQLLVCFPLLCDWGQNPCLL